MPQTGPACMTFFAARGVLTRVCQMYAGENDEAHKHLSGPRAVETFEEDRKARGPKSGASYPQGDWSIH